MLKLKNTLHSIFTNKSLVIGLAISFYFILLVLGSMIPSLRVGSGGNGPLIYRGILFGLFIVGITIIVILKKIKPNIPLLIALAIYMISNIIAICVVNGNIVITTNTKLLAVIYLLTMLFTIFVVFNIFPTLFDRKALLVLFISIAILSIVCTIYSLITEWSTIVNSFIAPGEEAHFYQVKSFFDNKNSYGFILFASITSLIYLMYITNKKLILIPIIYLSLNLVVSRAKAPIILLTLFLIVFLIYLLVRSYTSHKIRNSVITGIVLLLVALFFIIVYTPAIYNSCDFFKHLSNYFKEAFIGQGIRSMNERFARLSTSTSLFATPRIILGYGEHTVYTYANSNGVNLGYIDNSYIYNILAGGIFALGLFIYLYVLIFNNVIKITKLDKTNKVRPIIIWMLEIIILLYGLFENNQIMGSNYISLFLVIIAFIIPVVELKEESFNKETIKAFQEVSDIQSGKVKTKKYKNTEDLKKNLDI